MKTFTLIERHPVLNLCGVVRAHQSGRTFLVCDREDAGHGALVFREVTAYKVALQKQGAVLVIPEVLLRQVDFHIGSGQIVRSVPLVVVRVSIVVGLNVYRLTADGLACLKILDQFRSFGILINGVPVFHLSGRKINGQTARGLEGFFNMTGIVFIRKITHPCGGLVLVHGAASVVCNGEPVLEGIVCKCLALIPELVGDRHILVSLKLQLLILVISFLLQICSIHIHCL